MKHGIYRGIAMSVAGSDSGGGAGIQADLKTFAALKIFGTTAVTSVTVQNSIGVTGIHTVPSEIIEAQILSVGTDFPVDAIKTGMVGNCASIDAVVSGIKKLGIKNVVVDPVMIAQSGDPLIEDDAVTVLREKLLPLAAVATPNIPEAERLSEMTIANVTDMKKAAAAISKMGCRYVLLKGGHLPGDPDLITDILAGGGKMISFSDRRIVTSANHGTGCTLSSAIASELAAGRNIEDAVTFARRYLRAGLEHGVTAGHGAGCLGHAVTMDWIENCHE